MIRILLIACFMLAPFTASATFELEDPAKKVMEEKPADKMDADPKNCSRFVHGRENHADDYYRSLGWLIERLDKLVPGWSDHTDPDKMARWIDSYCRENPGDHLDAAVKAFMQSMADDIYGNARD